MSGAIRNPKGLRRRIGLQSKGAIPLMNRPAKDGARSSPHYGGEGVSHPPIAPRCLLAASKVGAGRLNRACPVLCGGRSAMSVPTAIQAAGASASRSRRLGRSPKIRTIAYF